LGWETGTIEITSSISARADKTLSDNWESKRLKIWTTEVDRELPGKDVKADDGGVTWEIDDKIRLPGDAFSDCMSLPLTLLTV
jgi:hypothetical protein